MPQTAHDRHRRPIPLVSVPLVVFLAIAVGPIALTACGVAILLYALTHAKEYQMRHAPAYVVDSLKDIMYGLIYPAVLGTGLVLFVLHITKNTSALSWLSDVVRYPALAAGCFYISSFTALSETAEGKARLSYQWRPFALDWLEVGLMFGCFYFLGFMDEGITARHLGLAYGCLLADVVLIQPMWRLAAGVNVYTFFRDRVVVGSLLIGGIISAPMAKLHPWVDMVIAAVVILFVIRYIARDVAFEKRQHEAQMEQATGDKACAGTASKHSGCAIEC